MNSVAQLRPIDAMTLLESLNRAVRLAQSQGRIPRSASPWALASLRLCVEARILTVRPPVYPSDRERLRAPVLSVRTLVALVQNGQNAGLYPRSCLGPLRRAIKPLPWSSRTLNSTREIRPEKTRSTFGHQPGGLIDFCRQSGHSFP